MRSNNNKVIVLRAKNFLSFKNEIEILFDRKTRGESKKGYFSISNSKSQPKEIANIIGFFGRNSSGKTNATTYMLNVFKQFLVLKAKENNSMLKNIAFFTNYQEDSYIEIEFLKNFKFFKYKIVFSNGKISQEILEYKKDYSSSKYILLFDKKETTVDFGNVTFMEANINESILGSQNLIAFMSSNHPSPRKIENFTKFIEEARTFITQDIFIINGTNFENNIAYAFKSLYEQKDLKDKFETFVNDLSLGFDEMDVKKEKIPTQSLKIQGSATGIQNIMQKNQEEDAYIPLCKRLNKITGELEEVNRVGQTLSLGTRNFISTITFLLESIKNNRVLVWEEFGCFLDDELIEAIIALIKADPTENSCQFIFNSNVKSILSNLHWDQVKIVKTDSNYVSEIINLDSDMYQSDLEKKYRNNYFENLNNINPISLIMAAEKESKEHV